MSAVGQVAGRVLNSFSIDEYWAAEQEYLRIATTQGWGRETDNRVFILQQSGEALTVVGQTESLAPGESIFSVRFTDTTGYVVTFRQVDPLFTIDLTDPSAPQVKGDLHITGFSNYLQPIGHDYLLGLGREADPETGRAEELQISLFDVSDLSTPTLADRFSFDVPNWAWTEALSDHHAVSYFPEHQVLTIPVTNGGGWMAIDRDADGVVDVQTYRPRTDLWVFQMSLPEAGDPEQKAGIELLGRIEDDSRLRRSVRIEDFVYAISDNSVSVHQILDPSVEIAALHFGQEDIGVPVFNADDENPIVRTAIESPELSPPVLVDVLIGSTRWDRDFVAYLDSANSSGAAPDALATIPFVEADQIKVRFSEDVIVGRDRISSAPNRLRMPLMP